MTRTKGTVVENNFIGGLNTEANALAFPTNACTETYNCVFDQFGRVSRRPEIDIEENGIVYGNTEYAQSQAFTEYLWTNAGGTGLVNVYVVQVGSVLFFYNVSDSTTVTKDDVFDFFNLDVFRVTDTTFDPRDEPCQYSDGHGKLIVTNKACDPILISYDAATNDVTASKITLQYRDFTGLESTYASTYRPPFSSIALMKADTEGSIHFYNLLNQGWWNGDISGGSPDANSALGKWDTARGDMPSSCDYIGFYRASTTNPFDATKVASYAQGNTLAPKGHFILDVGNVNRRQTLIDAGYTLNVTSTNASPISGATGTTIGAGANGGSNYALLFDGDHNTGVTESVLSTTSGAKTLGFFGGKNYSGTPRKVHQVIVNPRAGSYGHCQELVGSDLFDRSYPITIQLRGHSSAPSTGTEGTLLGSTSFTVTSSAAQPAKTIISSDKTTTFQYVWVYIQGTYTQPNTNTHSIATYLGSIAIYESVTSTISGSFDEIDQAKERPNTCAFYAGRAWYAGIDSLNLNGSIYYSQIINSDDQYGKCYQANDPTSEINSQLLPTDGGVVRIPEVGKIVKLYSQQNSLLVFATNGVWVIGGSGYGNAFSPTDYTVKRISSQGTQSPLSFIDVKGLPMWWGEDGIFKMDYNPQFDSFSVNIISIEKIQRFFNSIPATNRGKVKGAYDTRNDVAHWLYRSNAISDVDTYYEYDRVLLLNTRSGAFYPWSFDIVNATPEIKGIGYVVDAIGFDDSAIKYTIGIPVTSTTQKIAFADTLKRNKVYTDFADFSVSAYGVTTDAKNYSSYFVTGYRVDTQASKYLQSNYIRLFLEVEENSGAYLQGIFDFANTAQTGDWSTRQQTSKQQVYNLDNTMRDVHSRRLKIRGRGLALQLRVTSQQGKPFTIVGWSMEESANADV